MKSIELDRVADVGRKVVDRISQSLGGTLVVPDAARLVTPSRRERFLNSLQNVRVQPQLSGVRVIPVGQNMGRFRAGIGEVFAIPAAGKLYPGVITDKTSQDKLVITYLAAHHDELDPRALELNKLQRQLLTKAALLQTEGVGTHAADTGAPGREIGHTILGLSAVLKPNLLRGQHAVHEWAASTAGVAEHVTSPTTVAVYDIALRDGLREVREKTIALGAGSFLIDHPAFDTTEPEQIEASRFAVGLGLVALNSHSEGSLQSMTNRIVGVLEQL